MKAYEQVDVIQSYKILDKAISGMVLTDEDRLMLYRFKDKLTDSESFEFTVNRLFNGYQLKTWKDIVERFLNERRTIRLMCDFYLIPVGDTNWVLKCNDQDFLPDQIGRAHV